MGTIGGMCPEKKNTLSKCAFRALFAGLTASLMTTCVAGKFTRERIHSDVTQHRPARLDNEHGQRQLCE